jgi:hypothetical protein
VAIGGRFRWFGPQDLRSPGGFSTADLGYAGGQLLHSPKMAAFNFLTARGTSTVAALPTASSFPVAASLGQIRVVTDATSPTAGSAPVGGGAARALVWYNGTAWRVIGV